MLPKWIGDAGPEELGQLFRALAIAWEALELNANEDYRGNRTTESVRSFKALRRIEELGKEGE